MESDPHVDRQLLRQHYGKNYTEMLKLMGHKRDSHDDWDAEYDIERDGYGRIINLNPLDDFDKKRFKEGKLSFIGIKPRVDTGLKPTKAQRELEDLRRVKEHKMANKLKKIARRNQRRPVPIADTPPIQDEKNEGVNEKSQKKTEEMAEKKAVALMFAESKVVEKHKKKTFFNEDKNKKRFSQQRFVASLNQAIQLEKIAHCEKQSKECQDSIIDNNVFGAIG